MGFEEAVSRITQALKIDPQQVKDLFVKKAEAKAEMFLAGPAFMRGLKEILTPEQLKKLEAQGF